MRKVKVVKDLASDNPINFEIEVNKALKELEYSTIKIDFAFTKAGTQASYVAFITYVVPEEEK